MSIKAVQSNDKEDDKQWLTYWIVYSFLHISDSILELLFSSLPFYNVTKMCFLIWCFAPQSKGATIIYKRIIEPLFKRYQQHIDETTNKIVNRVHRAVSDVSNDILNAAISPRQQIIQDEQEK
jgi:receptor expression-enhancing protein 5/6